MLGRLEMTVDECIDAFTSLMDAVFDPKKKKTLPFCLSSGTKLRERYDTNALEVAIKKTIVKAGYPADALMRGPKKSSCKVYVSCLLHDTITL